MKRGILAEFSAPEPMTHAILELRQLGYRHLDAYSPYPVKEAEDALVSKRSPINWMVLPFALAGAITAFVVQWWCNGYDYPLNVGGRPLFSLPAWVPIIFEMGVLAASLSGFVILLILCGLPELSSPIFSVDGFESATNDGFWVSVDARDPAFDSGKLRVELLSLGATRVSYAGMEQP
jgi:hypothetical protein